MEKKTRILISCILVVVAVLLGNAEGMRHFVSDSQADAAEPATYFINSAGNIQVPAKDSTKPLGTEENPFFALEIVPFQGYAEFGYLISGCEPVDMQWVEWNGVVIPDSGGTYVSEPEKYYFWEEDVPEKFPKADGNKQRMNKTGTMTFVATGGDYKRDTTRDAYVEKPEGFTGTTYKQSWEGADPVYTEDPDGNFIKILQATYKKVSAGTGAYSFVPDDAKTCFERKDDYEFFKQYEKIDHQVAAGASFEVCLPDQLCYFNESGLKYTHKNDFLKESIGLRYEMVGDRRRVKQTVKDDGTLSDISDEELDELCADYKAIVYTVTPEDLNYNLDLITEADLIVISSKPTMGESVVVDDLYTPFHRDDLFKRMDGYTSTINKKGATFATNPIDWEVAVRIYNKATNVTKRGPVIMDTGIFSAVSNDNKKSVPVKVRFADGDSETLFTGIDGTQNNMYKLYMMLTQMNGVTLRTLFEDSDGKLFESGSANFGVTDTSFLMKNTSRKLKTGTLLLNKTGDAQKYWNYYTLVPWHMMPDQTYRTAGSYNAFLAVRGIATEADSAFQFNSTGFQNSVYDSHYLYNNATHMTQSFTKPSQVHDDAYGKEVYDYFHRITGSRPTKVTSAEIINYLLNGLNAEWNDNRPVDEDYRILELQPSTKWNATDEALLEREIKILMNSIGDITWDRMSTTEFIGVRIDYASEYDLIYIGMEKNTDDPTMKGTGFAYVHTGPAVSITGKSGMYGLLSGDVNNQNVEKNFAYSGNDLTALALQKLKAYRAAGCPIIFAKGMEGDATNASGTLIDRNSYMCDLIEAVHTDSVEKRLFMERLLTNQADVRTYLKGLLKNKVKMILTDSPILYDTTRYSDPADLYVNGRNVNQRTFTYEFDVKASATLAFAAVLYVDRDGDGVYSESEKLNCNLYQYNEALREWEVVQQGRITAGKRYRAERTIEDRVGSVDWKFALVDFTLYRQTPPKELTYASANGVSAILATTKKSLPILQIMPQDYVSHPWANCYSQVFLPTENDVIAGADSMRLYDRNGNEIKRIGVSGSGPTNAQKKVTRKFYEWTKSINGLDIKFTRLYQSDIIDDVEALHGTGATEMDYYNYLNKYEMVVLGFADCYGGVTDTKLLGAIEMYMANKAILYTHDASSYVGKSGSSPDVWGKTMTNMLRDNFGMDRYKVQTVNPKIESSAEERRKFQLRLGNALGDDEVIPVVADNPLLPTGSNSDVGKLYTKNGYAIAQGYANATIYLMKGGISTDNGNITTKKVSLINRGGITQYPYTLDEEIPVALTHPQYYQLNMENESMNVWYCLKNSSSIDGIKKYFEATPNDGRNNYYIYNIGNVTYSGMGHNGDLTDEEIKLFINTFVAAYRPGANSVGVVPNNTDVMESNGNYFMCIDVDSSDVGVLIGTELKTEYKTQKKNDATDTWEIDQTIVGEDGAVNAKRVYFYIKDTNSLGIGSYTMTTKRVKYDADGNKVYKPDGTLDTEELNLALYLTTESGSEFVTRHETLEASNTVIYYIDVPLERETKNDLSDDTPPIKLTEVLIEITATYVSGARTFTPPVNSTSVTIIPRGLFNLD